MLRFTTYIDGIIIWHFDTTARQGSEGAPAELHDNWERARTMQPLERSLAPMTTESREWPMVDVLRLRALDDHRLWLRFTDGNEGVRDCSDILAVGGPMVEPLQQPD